MIPYYIIKELVLSGCKFLYESYNYKEAVEELRNTQTFQYNYNFDFCKDEFIPDNIKQHHIVWRKGKLRKIHFNNNGEIFKLYIGNKRAKCFYLSEFGRTYKPILFKSDDVHDLINQGFAIEDKL